MEKEVQYFRQWWLSILSGIVFVLLGAGILVGRVARYENYINWLIIGFVLIGLFRCLYALKNKDNLEYFALILINGLIEIGILSVPFIFKTNIESLIPVYIGFILLFRCIIGMGVGIDFYYAKAKSWIVVFFFSLFGLVTCFLTIWKPVSSGFDFLIYPALTFLFVGIVQFGIGVGMNKLNKQFD